MRPLRIVLLAAAMGLLMGGAGEAANYPRGGSQPDQSYPGDNGPPRDDPGRYGPPDQGGPGSNERRIPDATPTGSPVYGSINSAVELVPGVAAPNCLITVTGTPRGARCGANGWFSIRGVDPGEWELDVTVTVPGTGEVLRRKAEMPVSPGIISSTAIVMARPTTVTGQVGRIAPGAGGAYYVAIEALRIAAPLSSSGGFVLEGVPPGRWRVELRAYSGETLGGPRGATYADVEVRTDRPMPVVTGLVLPILVGMPGGPGGPPGRSE